MYYSPDILEVFTIAGVTLKMT